MAEIENKSKKITLVPNVARILVKLIPFETNMSSGILVPGQLKAGENLFLGEVVHPGKTQFKKGQFVYFSEYSMAALYQLSKVRRGEMTYGDCMDDKNKLFVVAEDDIMAFEEVS